MRAAVDAVAGGCDVTDDPGLDLHLEPIWWTPDGLGFEDDAISYLYTQMLLACPYFISSNGGPRDLPGRFGPGTCGGICWEEPACVTDRDLRGEHLATRSDL